MTTRQMTDPIFDRSLRSVHFFNGRLLTAEDLSKEQAASREERRRLGRALGDGIAWGLEVQMTRGVDQVAEPSVTITPGLAIDRRGQTLLLEETVDLSLKITPRRTTTGAITTFQECEPPDASAYVAGAGLYLLTLTSIEGREGRALVSGLRNVEASCNTKYDVPGLQFRLTQINLQPGDLDAPDLLRNIVAHRFFGSDSTSEGLYTDPFGPRRANHGLIDSLRPGRLADCEVPLALLYWTSTDGLIFVDMWAARRRIAAPDSGTAWSQYGSDRRTAVAEAIFQQFQAQLDDLRSDRFVAISARATKHFRYLPPVGLVPLSRSVTRGGFNEINFFDGMTARGVVRNAGTPPIVIESARVPALLHESFQYPPLDLETRVMVWVYHVRENLQMDDAQPYVVFASGYMPYIGDAQFNVNRWSLSNFARWLESGRE